MVHLITGYAGKPHITSASDGAINAGMYGRGKYILNMGEKFAHEIISNNLIKIKSGYAINQGRKIEIAINDYEEVVIDNGLQGMKRCDLIVLRYEKSPDSGIETAGLAVIKGTSSDTYVEPEFSEGNIIIGEGTDDILLYKVYINGLSIEKVESAFSVTSSLMDILADMEKSIANAKALLSRSISNLNTLIKYTTVVTPNPTIGPQIIQKESEIFDFEGNKEPFPIQEVVAGHELALRQLNTDTKNRFATRKLIGSGFNCSFNSDGYDFIELVVDIGGYIYSKLIPVSELYSYSQKPRFINVRYDSNHYYSGYYTISAKGIAGIVSTELVGTLNIINMIEIYGIK